MKDVADLRKGRKVDSIRRSSQNILEALIDQGYASRLNFVDDMATMPNVVYAYYLNPSGAEIAENPSAALHPSAKFIVRHDIQIVQFHIHLKRWTDKQGLILHWYEPNMDIKRQIVPDAYFGIEDPKKPHGQNTLHYFLEIERAKIGHVDATGQPSIVEKLLKYYDYYDTDECQKDWGFRKFRVPVVVRTADKQYNLCERLSENLVHRKPCQFVRGKKCICKPASLSHRMFWITTEPLVKENIKGEIFKTPKDFIKVAYSFLSV